ncbi:ribonuclease P protein component 3 [uncultured Methanobrevibacter sp.]|uniref:ribonuclease P protein component 3 n=1 Tax=uncultured Methanobrevibacter sp. TaxID=253161 RepID=UPI00261723F3
MKFYDLNVRGQDFNRDLSLLKEANKFGWDYINFNYTPDKFFEAKNYEDELIEEIGKFSDDSTYRNKYNYDSIKMGMGINILNANSNEIRKITKKNRDKSNYISCLGGDLKVNRSACENPLIDVLSRPYYKRFDSGMNHVLAKEAARNNVAIELCFRDVLKNFLKYRANVISYFKEILMFHRKFKFPLILTTDSKLVYDVKSSRDVFAFFKSIGFSQEEIYNGFYYYPKQILDFNKERKNMVVKGVKVIEGATDFSETYKDDEELDKFNKSDFEDNEFDNFIEYCDNPDEDLELSDEKNSSGGFDDDLKISDDKNSSGGFDDDLKISDDDNYSDKDLENGFREDEK